MHLKHSQIESLSTHVIKVIKEKHLATFTQGDEALIHLVQNVFEKNFEEEGQLNDDARKLLDLNKKKIGQNIDEERALNMIKKQLAKERNFVL